jgi:hypothetical protein
MEIEIIVSRYNEDLAWTLMEPFCNYKYTVYNKGINENFEKKHVVNIIPLDNVGKEAHTYLYHIIQNYDKLSHITLFIPASINVHCKIYKVINTLQKIKETSEACFLAEYHDNIYELFKNFEIDYWLGTNRNNQQINTSGNLEPCSLRPFHKWYEHFFDKDNIISWWSYNSIFSLDKRDILQHPKERYMKLIEGLEKGNNLEEVHYIERAWVAVFYPLKFSKIYYYKQ